MLPRFLKWLFCNHPADQWVMVRRLRRGIEDDGPFIDKGYCTLWRCTQCGMHEYRTWPL